MKKNVTIIGLVLAVLFFVAKTEAFAQSHFAKTKANKNLIVQSKSNQIYSSNLAKIKNKLLKSHVANVVKANTTILTQDFIGTTFPPTGWTSQIVSGPLNWTRGTTTSLAWDDLNTTGSSFANGYAIANSDGVGTGQSSEDCVLKSPAINCTGYTNVWLKFNEYFRQYGTSTGHVEVSNNGTIWTPVHSSETGLASDSGTANPNTVEIDVSSYATGHSTFYVRFHWTGNYDYYWVVDDIEVYSKAAYDVALTAAANPKEYTVVPLAQYSGGAMTLSATAKNIGASSVSNVNMSVNVYNLSTSTTAHTTTSNTLSTLAPNTTGTLTAITSYTPPLDTSIYYIEYIVHMTQTDENHSNDTLYCGFWISDSLYARSDEMFTSTAAGGLGATSSVVIMGNDFTVNTLDKLSHVSCFITGGRVNDTTQIFVYSTNANGSPNAVIGSSAIYKFTVAGAQWVNLPIQGGPLSLAPGNYFVALKQFYTTPNIGLGYTNNNYTHQKAWLKLNASAFDSIETYGYKASFIVEPYLVCGNFSTNATANKDTICSGAFTTLHAINGTTYSWSPANSLSAVNIANPVATPTITTTYTVTVTNAYGCAAIDNIKITVDPKMISNTTSTDAICGQSNGYATVSVTSGGMSPFTYIWNTVPPQTTAIANGLAQGTYYVSVTDAHGCTISDTATVDCVTGIAGFTETSELSLNPNPSNGSFMVEINGNCGKEKNIAILNLNGQTVFADKWAITSNKFTKKLDLQFLAKGIYFAKFTSDGSVKVEKLVIK